MDPVTVSIIAASIGAVGITAEHVVQREHMKNGDVPIHNAADFERAVEQANGISIKRLRYRLHPDHEVELVRGETTPFRCKACTYEGTGFSCRGCNFDLHQACALSDDIMKGLIAERTKFISLVHEHPLNLTTGSSAYTCNYCINESITEFRYLCLECNTKFDLMCVNHPARLLSFLHPQHDLVLKTRHIFKKCSVCHHGGETNGRVYRCEECQFYAHPNCAMKSQYIQSSSHYGGDHALVLVANDKTVVCNACQKKCHRWCYVCSICTEHYFHPECVHSITNGCSTPFTDGFIEGSVKAVEDAANGLAVSAITGN